MRGILFGRSGLFPAAALACLALGGARCTEGLFTVPETEKVDPPAADMPLVVSDLALAVQTALQQYTAAELAAPFLPDPAAAPAGIDTLLRGIVDCPAVRHHPPSFYEFHYAGGCPSSFDGLTASGALGFTVNRTGSFEALEIHAEFLDFVRDGRRVAGFLDIDGSAGARLQLKASRLNLKGRADPVHGAFTMSLVPLDPVAGRDDPICAAWGVTRIDPVSMCTDRYLYKFQVRDTLVVSACYPHFVEGVLAVTSIHTHTALIDFGDGTCDDIATMTVEGRTQTLTLGYPP